ncbi:MAG: type II toxin-antitoxin system HicB family antitoxin [Verrucomicrobia bacterium]|nr:type II toxin-antitoxin system HicB family antitoxin [Verrucomicrobiota bacterium]
MTFSVELEQEVDGRWIAEVLELPGVLVYGRTKEAAITRAKALARHVLTDRPAGGRKFNHSRRLLC